MSDFTNIKASRNNIKHLEKSAENYDKEYNLALSCLHSHITQFNLANLYFNSKGIEKNLEKAFYWCQKSAENNSDVAMNVLAISYENGEGTEKNLEKAFYWYQKAAENGNNNAMNNLGIRYSEGTEKNLEKAFYWFQKAAENGNNKGMNNLGVCYYNGFGTEKNLEKALYWYQKAAGNGSNDAMYNLGIYCHDGFGTEKNLENVFYWYQIAAQNGNNNAMNKLGICHYNGFGIEKNLGKAFYWYQKAAENGDDNAMGNLGRCYYNGLGTEKNLEKAFYWYQKAAENGNDDAMYNLSKCYYNGFGTEKNLEKAFYWYQNAADNGNNYAINNLGIYYCNGEVTEKNFKKAFNWHQNAAENGNNITMNSLGIHYSEGTEKNLEKAFYWYQKAAENGDDNAMYNLGIHYSEGTEKNLEKAFYWFQKAAENGNNSAMNSLGIHYSEGTEKNLEKAFYWYQKAAENGDNNNAMYNLGAFYYKGEGTEKNLEKAFYWYQKAAENGDDNAMYNLGIHYSEGTEKNLEKAFYWYQKAAENGNNSAMNSLGIHYSEGTEKNLEKAFYWYQKAAENGNNYAMNNLIICYKNGKGTEKNLEKAFYWYQKAAENGIVNELHDKCEECKQQYTNYYQWCQQCNSKRFQQDFLKWTSKNEFIDKFIQKAQLTAKNINEVLEWIPYNRLKNINHYDEGGFSKIDKAIWLDGPIDGWNFNEQKWNRWTFQKGYEVILKNLNDSSDLNDEFLSEWKYNYNCQKKSFSKFVRFFGITQDPGSLNYIVVMSYVKEGSLRKCLSSIVKLDWYEKLQLLKKIILGLKIIHESGLVHCDLHDGNILISNNEVYIIDLGLCKPVSNSQNSKDIFGVLPYMAPEILRKKLYTPASDIYSFSMIMWEFTSGIPPFADKAHDYHLNLSICRGERPEIIKNTPKYYMDLMEACWDSEPTKRPTLKIIENTISEWLSCLDEYKIIGGVECRTRTANIGDSQLLNIVREFMKALQTNASVIQFHSQAFYKSRSLEKIVETLDQNKKMVFSSNSDCIVNELKSECLDCEIK